MTKSIIGAVLLWSLGSGASAMARGDLFLFGGGPRPPDAMAQLVASAGGASARVLVVAWASREPDETAAGVKAELAAAGAAVTVSPAPPANADESARFLEELARASALFFSGGDQNRVLEAFGRAPELREKLLERWSQGAALAGTSAGTAILSQWVFTGREDLTKIDPASLELAPGLGALADTIIDQHFIVRQRENRLIAAVLRYPASLGVGVDEGNALVVRQGLGVVYGPTGVVFVAQVEGHPNASQLAVNLVGQGACWDFGMRQIVNCP